MAAPTITLNCKLQDMFANVNQGSILFMLINFTDRTMPRVAGTAMLINQFEVASDATGLVTTPIWGNDVISPGPNGTIYCLVFKDAAGGTIATSMYQFTGSGVVDLSTLQPFNQAPIPLPLPLPAQAVLLNPPAPQNIVGQPLTISSGLFFATMMGIPWVGPGGFSSIAAALATLPVSGGSVWVAPNWTETFAANLVLKSDCAIIFTGPATINMGTFQITAPGGLNGAAIKTLGSTSTLIPSPGVRFIYTGTTDAFLIGDNTANSQGIEFANFTIIAQSSNSANGLHLRRVIVYRLDYLSIFGNNTGTTNVGLNLDGTGGGQFIGDSVVTLPVVEGFASNIQLNNNANVNYIIQPIVPNAAAGGIGIDFQSASGTIVEGGDVEGNALGVNFANNAAVTNNRVRMWFEANTNDVAYGANCFGNVVDSLTGNLKVTGAGAGLNGNVVWGFFKTPLINQQGPLAAIVGTGGDVAIYSFTLPANTVGPSRGLKIKVGYVHSTGNATVTYKWKFGSTVYDTYAYGGNANNTTVEWLEYDIYNNPAVQNAQNGMLYGAIELATFQNTSKETTGTIDFTQSQVLALTFNVAATDQITPKFFSVELS